MEMQSNISNPLSLEIVINSNQNKNSLEHAIDNETIFGVLKEVLNYLKIAGYYNQVANFSAFERVDSVITIIDKRIRECQIKLQSLQDERQALSKELSQIDNKVVSFSQKIITLAYELDKEIQENQTLDYGKLLGVVEPLLEESFLAEETLKRAMQIINRQNEIDRDIKVLNESIQNLEKRKTRVLNLLFSSALLSIYINTSVQQVPSSLTSSFAEYSNAHSNENEVQPSEISSEEELDTINSELSVEVNLKRLDFSDPEVKEKINEITTLYGLTMSEVEKIIIKFNSFNFLFYDHQKIVNQIKTLFGYLEPSDYYSINEIKIIIKRHPLLTSERALKKANKIVKYLIEDLQLSTKIVKKVLFKVPSLFNSELDSVKYRIERISNVLGSPILNFLKHDKSIIVLFAFTLLTFDPDWLKKKVNVVRELLLKPLKGEDYGFEKFMNEAPDVALFMLMNSIHRIEAVSQVINLLIEETKNLLISKVDSYLDLKDSLMLEDSWELVAKAIIFDVINKQKLFNSPFFSLSYDIIIEGRDSPITRTITELTYSEAISLHAELKKAENVRNLKFDEQSCALLDIYRKRINRCLMSRNKLQKYIKLAKNNIKEVR